MNRYMHIWIIAICFISSHAFAQDVAAEGGSSASHFVGMAVALLALAVALCAEALLVILAKKNRFNIVFPAAGVSFLVLIGVGSLVYHTTGAIVRGPSLPADQGAAEVTPHEARLIAIDSETLVAGNQATGKSIFQANCAVCHETEGKGKVGLAPSIRNRDFLALASDEFISRTITQGRPGTAMIGRVDLAGQSTKDIIAYLRSLVIANPVDITVDPDRRVSGDATTGAPLYASYCASCHGPHGEGYSAGGSGPGIGLPGFLDIASDDYIYQTIKQGRVGTAMMPFLGAKGLANLTEQEVNDIIVHLRDSNGSSASTTDDAIVSRTSDAVMGKQLFAANCAACHQADGKGHPGLAPSIRNRDFLAIASDDFIQTTVKQGRAGTMMVPRPDLGEQKVADIIAHLRSLKVANPVDIQVDPDKTIAGNVHSGIAKYAQFCASCHGPDGEGYSAGGSGPGIGLPGFLDVASDDYIYQTIKQGRVGTAMMPFLGAKGLANLTEQDIGDIIAWLRSHNPPRSTP